CAGGFASIDSGGGVFDDDTVDWGEAKNLCGFAVRLGIRLAPPHLVGCTPVSGPGDSGGGNANFGQAACARCSDGPAILRDCLQELEGAGEGNYAFDVFDFTALDFAIFRVVIGVRKQIANGGNAGASVGLADDVVGNETVFRGPFRPHARDSGSGVDQYAVEIEEHTAAHNFHALDDTEFWRSIQLGVSAKRR